MVKSVAYLCACKGTSKKCWRVMWGGGAWLGNDHTLNDHTLNLLDLFMYSMNPQFIAVERLLSDT